MINFSNIQHLHLEISSKCNARCPLCPRNFFGYPFNDGYVEHDMTLDEAKQILEFAYPKDKDNWFRKLSFEPKITEDGRQQVTFGMRPIIGIEYHNGQDNCILHFDNTKVVLWLYKNGSSIRRSDVFSFPITSTSLAGMLKGSITLDAIAGDYFEIKFVAPTWVINPTSTYFSGVVYIQ